MGLFGKKKGLVGVDIGSSAVKAVELKVGGKGGDEYQLVNIGMEPLHGLQVVPQDLGPGFDHALQSAVLAQKVRRQYFDGRAGTARADRADRVCRTRRQPGR